MRAILFICLLAREIALMYSTRMYDQAPVVNASQVSSVDDNKKLRSEIYQLIISSLKMSVGERVMVAYLMNSMRKLIFLLHVYKKHENPVTKYWNMALPVYYYQELYSTLHKWGYENQQVTQYTTMSKSE